MWSRIGLALVLGLLLPVAARPQSAAELPSEKPPVTPSSPSLADLLGAKKRHLPPDRHFTVMVPMRDGVRLSTLITLPEGPGPWPVILIRTPYGKETAGLGGIRVDFVSLGFAEVVQDTRGRFESEGTFPCFDLEKPDGCDTIAWIARQNWSNGKVGMFGVSAGGILANLAAMGEPPALVCSYVVVAHGCDFRFGSYSGGVYLKDLNERWFKALGHPLDQTTFPRIAVYDEVAAGMDMRNHHGVVKVPTYNVCGWYDCFCESGIENFEGLQQHGAGLARGNQKLWVGAFGHFPLNGKLRYPADAAKPDFSSVQRWFDHWLKGVDTGILKEPAVRYFLMGDPLDPDAPGNEWRTSDVWPPTGTSQTFFLTSDGGLKRDPAAERTPLQYTFDPRDPVPTVGGNNLFLPRGPMDQRKLASRRDILRFETDVLEVPMEIVGRVWAELSVSTDCQDTDFMAKLIDVYPDGYEALVLDQALRLRYREAFDKPTKAVPGDVYAIRINLGDTALVVNKGHKLALHITSSNSPRFEPHTNTWDPVPSLGDAKVAHNTIHVGGENASRLVVPVANRNP